MIEEFKHMTNESLYLIKDSNVELELGDLVVFFDEVIFKNFANSELARWDSLDPCNSEIYGYVRKITKQYYDDFWSETGPESEVRIRYEVEWFGANHDGPTLLEYDRQSLFLIQIKPARD